MKRVLSGMAVLGILVSGVCADVNKAFTCRNVVPDGNNKYQYHDLQIFEDNAPNVRGGLVTIQKAKRDRFDKDVYHHHRTFIQGFIHEEEEYTVIQEDLGKSYVKIYKSPTGTIGSGGMDLPEQEYTYNAELFLNKKEGFYDYGCFYGKSVKHGFGLGEVEKPVRMYCKPSGEINDEEEKDDFQRKENFEKLNQ